MSPFVFYDIISGATIGILFLWRAIRPSDSFLHVGLGTHEYLNFAICYQLHILYGVCVERIRHGDGQRVAYLIYSYKTVLLGYVQRDQFYDLRVDLII